MNKLICTLAAFVIMAGFVLPASAHPDKDHGREVRSAIGKLQHARQDLAANRSGDEYGGHRAEALKHIDEAIGELKAALEYAKAHPQDDAHHDHH